MSRGLRVDARVLGDEAADNGARMLEKSKYSLVIGRYGLYV